MLEIVARLRPDARRHLVVGEPEVLDQLLVGGRLLERVEVVALEVLDERLLERGRVVGVADERGDRLQPDPARRAPAALAGDQLVLAVAERAARAPAGAPRPRGSTRPATTSASSSKYSRGW